MTFSLHATYATLKLKKRQVRLSLQKPPLFDKASSALLDLIIY